MVARSFAVFSILLECCSLMVIDDLMTQDTALTGWVRVFFCFVLILSFSLTQSLMLL